MPILSHSREPSAVPGTSACAEVIAGLQTHVDLVVLDASRDLPATLMERLDMAVVVAGTGVLELSALAAASRRIAERVDETWVVLRARRETAALGEEVTRALDLPVLGWLRDDPRVHRNLVRGHGPATDGPVGQLARMLVGAAVPASSAVAS